MPHERATRNILLRGFTLVEALVALAVLSLIVLGLSGAMRTLGEVQQRVALRQARGESMEATVRVLRTLLEQPVRELFTPTRDTPGWPMRRIRYVVGAQSVEWVGIMPARPAMGGVTEFRLAVEPDPYRAGVRNLVLRYRPRAEVQGGHAFVAWEHAAAEILLSDIRELTIWVRSLQRPVGWSVNQPWDDAWRRDWPAAVRDVPQLLRLDIADALGAWPPVWIAVRPTPPSLAVRGRAVIGGSEVD